MRHYKSFKIVFWLTIFGAPVWFVSCSKMNSNYYHFIKNGEPVYTGKADSLQAFSGKERVKLTWYLLSDPSIVGCKITWVRPDGISDSTNISIDKSKNVDSFQAIISNLPEGHYNFYIASYDDQGHSSVKSNVEADVFGSVYRSELLNRSPLQSFTMDGNSLVTTWYPPDTVNVNTKVNYTNTLGQMKTVYLSPDSNSLMLPGWMPGSTIYYRSSYKPAGDAIDTFRVTYSDFIKVSDLSVDKSLWKAVSLPHDVGLFEPSTAMSWLWDGQPADYPDIFYSAADNMPCAFTFDLGKTYDHLSRMEEWGRANGYSAALHFEVWGIADTTGASVDMSPEETGWRDATLAKGWTLLTEVERNDNGAAGWTANLAENVPPVRFIRIRVLKAEGERGRMNMSELSFWYNP